ncbi:MAG: molecular chaperone DnaJ [Myxococcales bacterium]
MNCEASREAISHACRTLLIAEPDGQDLDAWRRQLRHAFQRRAFETHPDRAVALGRPVTQLESEFQAVNAAYHLLQTRRLVPESHRAPTPPPPPPAPAATSPRASPRASASIPHPAADHFYEGRCPKRRLRLGEMLYFKGHISWRTLMSALSWQRRQRPLLGQLAVEWGFLTQEQVQDLLLERCRSGSRLPFGEYAFRRGAITSFQLMALVGRQRQLQRPLGEYFVERGLLGAEVLARMILEQRQAALSGEG